MTAIVERRRSEAAMSVDFSLAKWYLDVVTEDGRVGIAYWAQLEWKRFRRAFCGLLIAERGTSPWRFTSRRVAPPLLNDGWLRWNVEPLGLTVEFTRREPGFRRRLLEMPEGAVDWDCAVPRADVQLRVGDLVLDGIGYAERLDLTLLPWHIPVDEVRWGRFLSPETSIVWIDWRGPHRLSLVAHDGRLVTASSISEHAIQFGRGSTLALTRHRVLSADCIGDLLAPVETLGRLVAPIARTRQTRWLARGELVGSGGRPLRGWVVHEVVSRPS